MRGIIVDNFAGGGGASTGIELATGRSVDIAINHDPAAIAMHRANHPDSEHYCESVWDVDPIKACKGRVVDLAWFSPDCKHFSKAKGGKPKDKNIRGLAWVAVKWAKAVKPRVIMLENVEEFKTWGPLLNDGMPDPIKKGQTFNLFVSNLKKLGYQVDWRELKACDYGAPTTRKRFFLIARCDGQKIRWPEPTHGAPNSIEVACGLLKPWRTAAEVIDWSIPCKSIFGRQKPLSENTLKRIAKGLQKFVIENPNPFIVRIGQTGFAKDGLQYTLDEPLTTIVSKAEHCLVTPHLIQYHSETSANSVRGQQLDEPIMTIDSNPRYGLVSAFISKNYAGASRSVASDLNDGVHTITARGCHSLVDVKLDKESTLSDEVADFFKKYYGKAVFGDRVKEPVNTIVSAPVKIGEARSYLVKYYGQSNAQNIEEPLGTVTSKDRFGLVTIKGEQYRIVDIGLRMLEPRELFKAQGFPDDYIIDTDADGRPYPKSAQVARCGNAVPPPFANALVRANLPEICTEVKEERHVS